MLHEVFTCQYHSSASLPPKRPKSAHFAKAGRPSTLSGSMRQEDTGGKPSFVGPANPVQILSKFYTCSMTSYYLQGPQIVSIFKILLVSTSYLRGPQIFHKHMIFFLKSYYLWGQQILHLQTAQIEIKSTGKHS
jgi:hypothetical protein